MATTNNAVPEEAARFRLGDWLVEPRLNRISRADAEAQLETKAMDVLVLLARRAGEVVSHAGPPRAVWQTEFVSYNTLAVRVSELREALGDDARNPRYIETIHKRGYRLIAEVSSHSSAEPDGGESAQMPPEEAGERSPYPGLSPFSEADAADFFGREVEIAALWRKIASRRLLAVIGSSGAGKSSLVRAGIVARAPPGWRAVVCTPGEDPSLAMARALAPDLAGDAQEMQSLLAFHNPDMALAVVSRWRGRWDEALIVIDQFEELFTLNSSEVQVEFVSLLRRLVDAAGTHVLLVLRDDFLVDCHRHPELAPIFSELTVVSAPSEKGLRQALTQPAARRLYGFETVVLIDEMVGQVEAERGALPLLAFAVSRLWELRDRDRRLLTREAYETIGGVGGALAQHAEETLQAIGEQRLPLVRELFRNLVTAQGTRAVRSWVDLLSVFPTGQRQDAESVLRALVAARLLTSFEDEAGGAGAEGPHHRVEVVHESLLTAWPRLQRWRTEDEGSAQLRDQLRQAARLWEEKGWSDDLLWTGTSYREYLLWRERYPGGLSGVEEAFGTAMTRLAERRRRRRRVALTAAIVVLVAVASALSLLWHRSLQETRRAEAAKLLALAQARLADDPTEALSLTTASLEVADTPEAREFVMRALWAGPLALEFDSGADDHAASASFSPDGAYIAAGSVAPEVRVWSRDGSGPIRLCGMTVDTASLTMPRWAAEGLLATGGAFGTEYPGFGDRVKLWSIPDGKLIREIDLGSPGTWRVGQGRLSAEIDLGEGPDRRHLGKSWRLPDGEAELLGTLTAADLAGAAAVIAAPDGSGWVIPRGRSVYLRPFDRQGPERLLEVLDADASVQSFGENGVLVSDETGKAHLWSFTGGEPTRVWAIRRPASAIGAVPDPTGRRFARFGPTKQSVQVWELEGLPGAVPLELRRSGGWYLPGFAFNPDGSWCVATTHLHRCLTFWPLARPYASVVEGWRFPVARRPLTFSPDSRWLAVGLEGGRVRLLPMPGSEPAEVGELYPLIGQEGADIRFDPEGRYLFVLSTVDAWVVPLDGGPSRLVVPRQETLQLEQGAVSPSGERVASAHIMGERGKNLYVFDVATGAVQSFALPEPDTPTNFAGVWSLGFLDEQTLITAGWGGVRRWDLAAGTQTLVAPSEALVMMVLRRATGTAITWGFGWSSDRSQVPGLKLLDLASGESRPLQGFGDDVEHADLDPSGTVLATCHKDGSVRVGRLDGGEAHLLLGHKGNVTRVAISPDLRWVASAGEDGTLRLWPVPDLSKPPLHTLPHGELLAKLGSLTNLRAVRDETSDTGWTIELGPFPGWRNVPNWNP